jgi:hypothetical protein
VINLSEESEDIRAIKSHFRNVVLKKDKWSWLWRCFDNTQYKS